MLMSCLLAQPTPPLFLRDILIDLIDSTKNTVAALRVSHAPFSKRTSLSRAFF
jgi:hypothetical protein